MLRGQDSDLLRKLMGLPGKPFPTLPRDDVAARVLYEVSPTVVKENDWCDYQMMRTKKPDPLLLDNYLLVAQSSVGTRMFRKLHYRIGGQRVEVLRDGDLSCAFFVSAALKIFGLIGELHTTVAATVTDLRGRGWKLIPRPRKGAIIVWAPKKFRSGETHRHIGIYPGGGRAVSNSSKRRSPRIHAWNYRPVEGILWNSKIR